jgi:membrane peptidoglycan carboxypeptidase
MRDGEHHRVRALAGLVLAVAVVGALIGAFLLPVAMGLGHVAGSAANRFLDARCDVHEKPPAVRSTMYARDGRTVLARFFTQDRSPVPISSVPQHLLRALVDTEDRRFYDHHGVDLRGLLRAAAHDAGGGDTQGGSTLTMQYVKQVRYYQATTESERQAAIAPTLDRKLQNAKCAIDIEHQYGKSQILEKYLNIAFFGENAYGIATAARTYFGKPVADLTVGQSALLVGLLRAPSQYDPFHHPALALQRRNEVLANMVAVGDLDRASATRYAQTSLGLDTKQPPPVREGCAAANPAVANSGFFCDYAVNWMRAHGLTDDVLTTGGLSIVTTLDAGLQSHGQAAVWRAGLKPSADYVLVMPSVDPRTGGVTSMISSRKYGMQDRRSETVDPLFTAAYAGAGSTYKYFTAATALAAGAPTSLKLTTANNRYRTKNCNSGHYTVHNAGNYPDTMTLGNALPQSSNTYFVAVEDEFFGCHLAPVVDTAVKLGMNRLRQPLNSSAATAIATEVVHSEEPTFTLGQEPTSSLELTGAFSAAANDGVFCPPHPIVRVTSSAGKAVPLRADPCRRVLTPYVARTLVSMMRNDTRSGTAASYFRGWYAHHGAPVAGKTGTDNDAADRANSALWFVGSTPHLVAAASLVNPKNPKQTVHDLPGLPGTGIGQDTFGAFAAKFWLAAYAAPLHGGWSWPSAAWVPGGRTVPRVIGRRAASAGATLRAAGLVPEAFPVACASSRPAGEVAYQQPPRAVPGSVVTFCLSSGSAAYVYTPPPPPPPVVHTTPVHHAPKPRPAPRPRQQPTPPPFPKPPHWPPRRHGH